MKDDFEETLQIIDGPGMCEKVVGGFAEEGHVPFALLITSVFCFEFRLQID